VVLANKCISIFAWRHWCYITRAGFTRQLK
jgi:hypothetical protein